MEHLAEYILASSIVLLALLVLIGLMAYVFAWRASKKKTTGAQKLQENLAPGQLVVLADGIYGLTPDYVSDARKEGNCYG